MARFARGTHAKGECDRCGLAFPLNALRRETTDNRLTNTKVCEDCFDSDHPQLQAGKRPIIDAEMLREPRPDRRPAEMTNIRWGWLPVFSLGAVGTVGSVSVVAASVVAPVVTPSPSPDTGAPSPTPTPSPSPSPAPVPVPAPSPTAVLVPITSPTALLSGFGGVVVTGYGNVTLTGLSADAVLGDAVGYNGMVVPVAGVAANIALGDTEQYGLGNTTLDGVASTAGIGTVDVTTTNNVYTVMLSQFGGGPAQTLATNQAAYSSAVGDLNAHGGGVLVFNPGTYNCGNQGSNVLLFSAALNNIHLVGTGVTMTMNTTSAVTPVFFHVPNPINVTIEGFTFSDPGAIITGGTANRGADCIYVPVTSTCSGLSIVDCSGVGVNIFIDISGGAPYTQLTNTTISGCSVNGAYYGIIATEGFGLTDLARSNWEITCTSVRRAVHARGLKRTNVTVTGVGVTGQAASNGFISAHAHTDSTCSDADITLNLSGDLSAFETFQAANSGGMVHLWHQDTDNTTPNLKFSNVTAAVHVNSLTAGNPYMVAFSHFTTVYLATTVRMWENVHVDGSVTGSYSGQFVRSVSASSASGNSVVVGADLQSYVNFGILPAYFTAEAGYAIPTGVAATGAVGAVDAFYSSGNSVVLTGLSATASLGVATASNGALVDVTGLSATASLGTTTPHGNATVPLTAAGIGTTTGGVGTVTVTGTPVSPVRYIRDSLNGSVPFNGNSTSYWVEIMAFDAAGNNVAFQKTVTATGFATGNLQVITNGNTNSSEYVTAPGSTTRMVTIDLGAVMNIASIKVWHYYLDGRVFQGTKTEVSTDNATWTTIFDSAVSGTYAETSAGKTIAAPYSTPPVSVTPRPIPALTVNLADYGGVPTASVTTIRNAFTLAFNDLKANNGGTLEVNSGTYNFGTVAQNAVMVAVTSLRNVHVKGDNVMLQISTGTGTGSNNTPVFFQLSAPDNVTFSGFSFEDFGSDILFRSAGGRWGAIAFNTFSTTAVADFKTFDCNAVALVSFIHSDNRSNPYTQTKFDITANIRDCYYGVQMLQSGTDSVCYVNMTNGRRSGVWQCPRNWDINVTLNRTEGIGSNGVVHLDSGNSGNLLADGVTAHVTATGALNGYNALVRIEHQGTIGAASVHQNHNINVNINNASSAASTGVVTFSAEEESGASGILSSTAGSWRNVTVRGTVTGTYTGTFIRSLAASTSGNNSIAVGSNLWGYQTGLPAYYTQTTP